MSISIPIAGAESGTDRNGELTMELNDHANAKIYSMLGTPSSQSDISVLAYRLELAYKSVRELQAQVCDLQSKLQQADAKLQEMNIKHARAKEEAVLNANAVKRNIALCEELRQECELLRSDRDVFEEAMLGIDKQRASAESRAIEAEMREKAALRRLERLLPISPIRKNQSKHNGYLEEMLPPIISNKRAGHAVKLLSMRLSDCEMIEENMACTSVGQDSAKFRLEGLSKSEHSPQKKKAKNGELHQCRELPANHYKLTSFDDDNYFHTVEAFATSGELKVEEGLSPTKSVLEESNFSTDDSSVVRETSDVTVHFSTNPRLTDKNMGTTVSEVSTTSGFINQLKKRHSPKHHGQLEPRKKGKEWEQQQCDKLTASSNDNCFHAHRTFTTAEEEHKVEEKQSARKSLLQESKLISGYTNAVEQTSESSTCDLESTSHQSESSTWTDVEQLKSELKICQQNLLKSEIEGAVLCQKNKELRGLIMEFLSSKYYCNRTHKHL